MSKADLQDKPIIVGTPVEIESAIERIRQELSVLPWVDYPFFIAQRFFRRKNNRNYVYPETYCKDLNVDPSNKYPYHRLTPDNDYSGMFFFMVGTGRNDFNANEYNYITYPVSIIFSVNLENIDKAKLDLGLFTQELIRDARRVLTDTMINHEFDYEILTETRDLRECFKEFVLDDLEQYNRAPMQCFRFDLSVRIQEECP